MNNAVLKKNMENVRKHSLTILDLSKTVIYEFW